MNENSSRHTRAVIGVAFLSLLVFPACALPTMAIEPRFGSVDLAGDFGLAGAAASADNSLEELGIDGTAGTTGLRGDFQWGSRHLSVVLQRSKHDGGGRLAADLSEGGTTIAAGTEVTTDVHLGLHSAALTFDVLEGDPWLGLGFGLAAVELDLEVRETAGSDRVAVDQTLPLPFLALRAGTRIGKVELEALGNLFAISILNQTYHYVDVDLQGRVRVLGDASRATAWLTFGLRRVDLDVEFDDGDDEAALDWTLTGPYIGLRVEL